MVFSEIQHSFYNSLNIVFYENHHHPLTVSHITVWPKNQISKYYIYETEKSKWVSFSLTDYFKWLFNMVYYNMVTCILRGCSLPLKIEKKW